MKIWPIMLIGAIFLACCSPSNCNDEMDKIKRELGAPEEVTTYSESNYHSETWWYWSKGISYTFKWGSIIEKGCEVSKYTFPPIPQNSPPEVKANILDQKKINERIWGYDQK
jgi:hypothetical protein